VTVWVRDLKVVDIGALRALIQHPEIVTRLFRDLEPTPVDPALPACHERPLVGPIQPRSWIHCSVFVNFWRALPGFPDSVFKIDLNDPTKGFSWLACFAFQDFFTAVERKRNKSAGFRPWLWPFSGESRLSCSLFGTNIVSRQV
jgi:hypothetical protein